MERLVGGFESSLTDNYFAANALQRALCHRRFHQVRRDLEQLAGCKKMRGGVVCLPIDVNNDDYLLVKANPFDDKWRVDHMWDQGVREHIFIFSKDAQTATMTVVDKELDLTMTHRAGPRDLGRLHRFITTHCQEQIEGEALQRVVALETSLLESTQSSIAPIIRLA